MVALVFASNSRRTPSNLVFSVFSSTATPLWRTFNSAISPDLGFSHIPVVPQTLPGTASSNVIYSHKSTAMFVSY
jgi:hypothetical protein